MGQRMFAVHRVSMVPPAALRSHMAAWSESGAELGEREAERTEPDVAATVAETVTATGPASSSMAVDDVREVPVVGHLDPSQDIACVAAASLDRDLDRL